MRSSSPPSQNARTKPLFRAPPSLLRDNNADAMTLLPYLPEHTEIEEVAAMPVAALIQEKAADDGEKSAST